MNDDVLLIVINLRSFEYTVQKRIRIFLNLIKTEPSNIVVGKKITDTFLKTKFSV